MGGFALALTVGAAGTAFALGSGVKHANPWGSGSPPVRSGTPANKVAPKYQLKLLAQGTDPLENPSGTITQYGFLSDGTPTEPDQNTYVVFPDGLDGPTAGYDYGKHFLFQGHENAGNNAYLTRINLDVSDPDHRITLLTPVDGGTGLTGFNSLDGSTYDPFSGTLLATQEAGASGGVVEVAPDGSSVQTLYGQLGRGGYEGIHTDLQGRIYMAEDAGGVGVRTNPNDPTSPKAAKQPNSFIYRYLPSDRTDLSAGGRLQVLQVEIGGNAVTFHAADPVGDTYSTAQQLLNTPGLQWPVSWVTIHDTATDGTAPFDANALAKAAGGTPFKRPENLAFKPHSDTRTFDFVATGDTNALAGTPALTSRGSYGTVFKVRLNSQGTGGSITPVVLGDETHNSFDNITWASTGSFIVAEDRGDTLHMQLNTLDSVWQYGSNGTGKRLIALGRDPVSLAGDEDNEPTGMYVSNGSADVGSMYGTEGDLVGARGFLTEQHGENRTFEVLHNFAP